MTARSRKRMERDADTRAVVGSTRDTEALTSLAWAGFLETSQIERLHFPSRRVAQRRLRALLDHGLVRAHLQGEALQRPNVYTMTRTGLERLTEQGRFPDGTPKPSRMPRPQHLRHALAVRETFVAFVLAEKTGAFELKDFRFDADLGGVAVFKAAHLVPDALAEFVVEGFSYTVGIEVDLGTETTATLAAKFSAWSRLLGAGFGSAPQRSRLLATAPTAARVATLARLLKEVGLAPGGAAESVTLDALPALLASGYPHGPYARGVRDARTGGVFQPVEIMVNPTEVTAAFKPLAS
jgi:hypothetical protein